MQLAIYSYAVFLHLECVTQATNNIVLLYSCSYSFCLNQQQTASNPCHICRLMGDLGHLCGSPSSDCPLYNCSQEYAFHFLVVCLQLHFARLALLLLYHQLFVLFFVANNQLSYEVLLGIYWIPDVQCSSLYLFSLGDAFPNSPL